MHIIVMDALSRLIVKEVMNKRLRFDTYIVNVVTSIPHLMYAEATSSYSLKANPKSLKFIRNIL